MAPRPREHSTEDVGGREGLAEKEISAGGPMRAAWRLRQWPRRGRGCLLEGDGVQVSRNSPGLMTVPKLTASKCKMKGFLRSDAQDSGKN